MTPEEKTAKIKEHQVTQDEIAKALGFYLLRNRKFLGGALFTLYLKIPQESGRGIASFNAEEREKVGRAMSDILHNLNRNGGVYDARQRDIDNLRGVGSRRY